MGDRLALTVVVSLASIVFVWVVSFPIAVYSAVRQYSIGDYLFTFLGYIGLATPNFLLALVLMYLSQRYFGQSVGGLFSPAYENAPWSWGKFKDLLAHLAVPVIVRFVNEPLVVRATPPASVASAIAVPGSGRRGHGGGRCRSGFRLFLLAAGGHGQGGGYGEGNYGKLGLHRCFS